MARTFVNKREMIFWLKRLFSVNGRAGNLEFFVINLFGFALLLLLGTIESKLPFPEWLGILLSIIMGIPQITVRIRRWHDMGNGWQFIFLDLLFFRFLHLFT